MVILKQQYKKTKKEISMYLPAHPILDLFGYPHKREFYIDRMKKLSKVLYVFMIVAGSFTFMGCSANLYHIIMDLY